MVCTQMYTAYDVRHTIGMNVRRIRKSKGLEIFEVIGKMEKPYKSLERLELGLQTHVSINALIDIADALGADVFDFFRKLK